MSKRKEEGKYGETHSFKLNDWQPTKQQVEQSGNDMDDIPF